MSKNMIIGAVVVLVVLGGGFFLFQSMQQPTETSVETPTVLNQNAPESTAAPTDSSATSSGDAGTGAIKEIIVSGSNFKFEPASITVNKGDQVKIVFQNAQGLHDFTLPDFKVQTKQIGGSQTDSVTFTADKTGSFEYFCSVGNHRAQGMKGTLIVK